jgi:diguanylate cyclase (GGDEF)-like protein
VLFLDPLVLVWGGMAKILIVEDSPLIARLAKNMLNERSHQVLLAHDGLAGLELAETQLPDLILLDVVIPGLDGYEVCRRLKNSLTTRDIPVIMLTSKAEPSDKVLGFQSGAVDYVTKPFDAGELIARVDIHLRLRVLYEALQEKNRQLQEQADRDGLTGLHNHRYFHEQLTKEFARAQRYKEPLSCVLLDIDYFKRFNDTHGHQVGDGILKTVSELIAASIRESDTAARYGGEEFALILFHTGREEAVQVAERLRKTVEQTAFRDGRDVFRITLSAGVGSYPHVDIDDPKKLLECADKALYRAKHNGRNRVEAY